MANTEVGFSLWGELQTGPKWIRRDDKALLVVLVVGGVEWTAEIYEPQPARVCVVGDKLVQAQDLGPVRRFFAFPATADGLKARLESGAVRGGRIRRLRRRR